MTNNEIKLARDLENYGILTRYDDRKTRMAKLFKRSVDRRVSIKNRKKAREELILINTRYILFAGRKIIPDSCPYKDDLIQEGLLLLVDYIDNKRYDIDTVKYIRKGGNFTLTYLFINIILRWKKYTLDQWAVGTTGLGIINNNKMVSLIEDFFPEEPMPEYYMYCYNGSLKSGFF